MHPRRPWRQDGAPPGHPGKAWPMLLRGKERVHMPGASGGLRAFCLPRECSVSRPGEGRIRLRLRNHSIGSGCAVGTRPREPLRGAGPGQEASEPWQPWQLE